MTPLQFVEQSRDYNFERRLELARVVGAVESRIRFAMKEIKQRQVGDALADLQHALNEINNVCSWTVRGSK